MTSLVSRGALAIQNLNVNNVQALLNTIKSSFDDCSAYIANLNSDITEIKAVYSTILDDRKFGYSTSVAPLDISGQLNESIANSQFMTQKYNQSMFALYFELYRLGEMSARAAIEVGTSIKPMNSDNDAMINLIKSKMMINKSEPTTCIYNERLNPDDMCSPFVDKSSCTFDDIQNVVNVIINCLEETAKDIDIFDDKIMKNTNLMKQGFNVGAYVESLKDQKSKLATDFLYLVSGLNDVLNRKINSIRSLESVIKSIADRIQNTSELSSISNMALTLLNNSRMSFEAKVITHNVLVQQANIYQSQIDSLNNQISIITSGQLSQINSQITALQPTATGANPPADAVQQYNMMIAQKTNLTSQITNIQNNISSIQTNLATATTTANRYYDTQVTPAQSALLIAQTRYNSSVSIDQNSQVHTQVTDIVTNYNTIHMEMVAQLRAKNDLFEILSKANSDLADYQNSQTYDSTSQTYKTLLLSQANAQMNYDKTTKNIADLQNQLSQLQNQIQITETNATSNDAETYNNILNKLNSLEKESEEKNKDTEKDKNKDAEKDKNKNKVKK
jgi:hypothetical protein